MGHRGCAVHQHAIPPDKTILSILAKTTMRSSNERTLRTRGSQRACWREEQAMVTFESQEPGQIMLPQQHPECNWHRDAKMHAPSAAKSERRNVSNEDANGADDGRACMRTSNTKQNHRASSVWPMSLSTISMQRISIAKESAAPACEQLQGSQSFENLRISESSKIRMF